MKIATEELKGRVTELNLADLNLGEDQSFRKVKLCIDDVQGRNCLTVFHVEQLIREAFEKATTHHHFIDMYADLCEQLHEFFTENPIGNDAKNSFKKVLLGECQGVLRAQPHGTRGLGQPHGRGAHARGDQVQAQDDW